LEEYTPRKQGSRELDRALELRSMYKKEGPARTGVICALLVFGLLHIWDGR
jgi:hypothetical protein